MTDAAHGNRKIPISGLHKAVSGRTWLRGKAALPGYPENGEVLVIEWNSQLFAIPARCPHQGFDLAGGFLSSRGDMICPNHGCVYPLETGNGFAFPIEKEGDGFFVAVGDVVPPLHPQCTPNDIRRLEAENDSLRVANRTLESRIQKVSGDMDAMLIEVEGRKRELEALNSRLESMAGLVSRIADSIQDILLVAGLDGRVSRVSQGAISFFGVSANALIGREIDSLLHPSDLERLRSERAVTPWSGRPLLYELIYADEKFEAEVALRSLTVPAGEEQSAAQHHLLHGSLLYDANGKEEGVILLISNIQGVKEREQLVREREMARSLDLLRAMIANIDQGMVMFNADDRIVVWNRRFLELLDLPESIVQPGTAIETLLRYHAEHGEYGPGDVGNLVNDQVALIHRTMPQRFERERPNGLVLDVARRPLTDGGFVATYTDITERRRKAVELKTENERLEQRVRERTADLEKENEVRKRTEEALRASRERLRGIADSLHEGVLVINHAGHMIFINASARRLLDVKELDVEGLPADHVMTLIDKGEEIAFDSTPWKQVSDQGIFLHNDDCVFKTSSGKQLQVAFSCAPLETGNGRNNAVVSFRDIASLKQAQFDALQSSRLASVGRLAAGIAHEINTPIQYIANNLSFIGNAASEMISALDASSGGSLERADGGTVQELDYVKEELPAAIKESQQGVEQISRIVLSMKEFSHPGSTVKAMSDINRAIENTLTVSRNQWKMVADVVKEFDPALPAVNCNIGEMNQVFLNLIVNAAQAIEGSGKSLPGTITVTTRQSGKWVTVSVADNGTGMTDAVKDKLFDPFFTTKDVGKGTGQGLAICRDVVVTKHRGRIEIGGIPGEGAIFTIWLPLEAQPEADVID
ncbi:MAG: PAS-domain containing protein [Rhodospirillales bacterium]|nr:PAS-domain containing protein [Rhodospirillales bacterium]